MTVRLPRGLSAFRAKAQAAVNKKSFPAQRFVAQKLARRCGGPDPKSVVRGTFFASNPSEPSIQPHVP
jgi:hypothetical protein